MAEVDPSRQRPTTTASAPWRRWLSAGPGRKAAIASLVLSACPAASPLAAAERCNVLFLAVDDLSTRLGCYGLPSAATPHLDALAGRGVKFDRAYCQYPSCGPSRASVLTGLRPQTTRVRDNRTPFRDTVPDAVTLPQWFRRHGFRAARVGKIFHQDNPTDIGSSGLDDPLSWDEVVNPRGRDKDEEHLLTVYTPDLPLPDQMAWLAAEGGDGEQTDGKVADEAIARMRQMRDRPFFLAVGFYRPHLPSIAPRRYFELHPPEAARLPGIPADYRARVPSAALASTPVWPNFGVAEDEARACIRAYDATVSFVDAQIGRLLAELDGSGLSRRTLVVLWSDHGYHLGEHGLWRKNSLFEESCRTPLIVAGPGVREGGVVEEPVELVDLFPTICAAAGLPLPDRLEGTSLLPLLRSPAAIPEERPAFSEVHFKSVPGRSIRTRRWRYTEWGPGGSEGRELYDHDSDPREMSNLAADPAFAATLHELAGRLRRRFSEPPSPSR